MFWRWIIRSCFLLPLLLCLGGWGWSGTHGASIRRTGSTQYVACTSEWGIIQSSWGLANSPPNELDYGVVRMVEDHFWPVYTGYSYWGFACYRLGGYQWSWNFCVPYWFLILFFGGILFFVWRKTGQKEPEQGFPVEIKASTTTTTGSKTGTISG